MEEWEWERDTRTFSFNNEHIKNTNATLESRSYLFGLQYRAPISLASSQAILSIFFLNSSSNSKSLRLLSQYENGELWEGRSAFYFFWPFPSLPCPSHSSPISPTGKEFFKAGAITPRLLPP